MDDIICNVCGKPDHSPHRRWDNSGRITEGCIAACHTGRITSPSASADWHNRKEARELRKRAADSLRRKINRVFDK